LIFFYLNNSGENKMASFDKELDARGLNCPLPILRTKKFLQEMGAGQTLKILATDRARKDFRHSPSRPVTICGVGRKVASTPSIKKKV
jgi:hypothetical protein